MTGLYDGPTLSEESDLFDGELINEIGANISPSNSRRRNRSGSCSEFMFGLRQGHLSGGGNCQGSPQTPRSSDANGPSECLRFLIRYSLNVLVLMFDSVEGFLASSYTNLMLDVVHCIICLINPGMFCIHAAGFKIWLYFLLSMIWCHNTNIPFWRWWLNPAFWIVDLCILLWQ